MTDGFALFLARIGETPLLTPADQTPRPNDPILRTRFSCTLCDPQGDLAVVQQEHAAWP